MSEIEAPAPPAATVSAGRIGFVSEADAGQRVLCEFVDPYCRKVVWQPVAPEVLLAASRSAKTSDGFDFLFIPSGSASTMETKVRAEGWMGVAAATGATGRLEMVMRSDRVLWCPGRAMVEGAAERMEENLLALVHFAFYEGELRKLENETAAEWERAEADASLTHGVMPEDLNRWPVVNEMTEKVTYRRIRFARLEPHLERPSPTLAGPAQRLYSELASQAGVVDRLAALDDRLEVFEDLYELANDRLSEFKYFRAECRLEIWIIVILVLEIVVMLVELYAFYRSGE